MLQQKQRQGQLIKLFESVWVCFANISIRAVENCRADIFPSYKQEAEVCVATMLDWCHLLSHKSNPQEFKVWEFDAGQQKL